MKPEDISNIRKLVVGTDLSNCVKYQKGSEYSQPGGKCKLVAFQASQKFPDSIDIYLHDGSAAFYWKSIHVSTVLEAEQDSSFK